MWCLSHSSRHVGVIASFLLHIHCSTCFPAARTQLTRLLVGVMSKKASKANHLLNFQYHDASLVPRGGTGRGPGRSRFDSGNARPQYRRSTYAEQQVQTAVGTCHGNQTSECIISIRAFYCAFNRPIDVPQVLSDISCTAYTRPRSCLGGIILRFRTRSATHYR